MAVSVKLDDALKSRVQDLATSQRRTSHWIMREAIQQYVEREEARESFRQEALASWAEYQQTRQHLTGGETRMWLQSWGETPDADAPTCHE
jgi:predicted transcriptional regulator